MDTEPAAAAAAGASAPVITFKKKGAGKRKEFRAPAQSLAGKSDDAAVAPAALPAAPAAAAAVSVEDDTHNDEDAHASASIAAASSSSAAAAAASSSSASSSSAARNAANDDADSDSDDESRANRPSIAFSAADAAAAAAAIEEEEPEDDEPESGVQRPIKRAKKDNPLVQSTRNKLKKDGGGLTIQSTRSVVPDARTADKQITQDVDSSKVKRDPTKPKWSGPSKPQASNVRMISRFDYQPDVCKDYKETGRCGYGDACKFMHDRGDYKAGWQLEKDWAAEQENKRKRVLQGLSADAEEENFEIKAEDEMPWACLICRESFTNPVVTKCKHYFCEKCALDAYVKDTKCFACRAQTHGIFNTANDLLAVIKKRSATGHDPKQELEALEQERLAEKAKSGWAIP